MKLILIKDQPNLGSAGDEVSVKDGYGRNFLIPNKIAIKFDAKSAAKVQAQAARNVKESKNSGGGEFAEALQGIGVLEFTGKATKTGKLYGSISAKKIADELNSVHNIEVAADSIELGEPIKSFGAHKIKVNFGGGDAAELNIQVSAAEK